VLGGALLNDLILALACQIAFYYGLTGLRAVWYFGVADRDARNLWLKGILRFWAGGPVACVFFRLPFGHRSADDWRRPGAWHRRQFWLGVGAIALASRYARVWNLVNRTYSGRTMTPAEDLVARVGSPRPPLTGRRRFPRCVAGPAKPGKS